MKSSATASKLLTNSLDSSILSGYHDEATSDNGEDVSDDENSTINDTPIAEEHSKADVKLIADITAIR